MGGQSDDEDEEENDVELVDPSPDVAPARPPQFIGAFNNIH